MIPKQKDAEDVCPSCKQVLVCREVEYKGNTKLQWQYKNKEEAHFSFDFATKKSACKESGGDTGKQQASTSTQETINLDKLAIPGDQVAEITNASVELAERLLVVLKAATDVCHRAGISHPATIGMVFNQMCEQRRYSGS